MVYVKLARGWTDGGGAAHAAGDLVDVDPVTLAVLESDGVVAPAEQAGEPGPAAPERPAWPGPTAPEPAVEPVGWPGPTKTDPEAWPGPTGAPAGEEATL